MMQMTRTHRWLSCFLCIVLIAAAALFTSGCGGNQSQQATSAVTTSDSSVLGEGDSSFFLSVTDADGNESNFEIHTDKPTVGEALLDLGLIAGENGSYGLYIKTVNGITADYDKDGTYWAFYIDGNYATNGIDSTEITDGATYALKVQ